MVTGITDIGSDVLLKVDLLYMQNLRSIAEIHETGVTAENFHEVSRCCIISAPVTSSIFVFSFYFSHYSAHM